MALPDLYPIPFQALVARLLREVEAGGAIYDVARRDTWVADPDASLSVAHLAGRAATPLGPASGPHTQMAQNIVVAWLAGARIMELKTVQVNDELVIPRPCIYVPHIGFNVEWSQELRVDESALEYIKAWYLIHALMSPFGPGIFSAPSTDTIFDLSVGYDLAGVRSEKVRRFLEVMCDATPVLDALRGEIRARFPALADLAVPSRVASSVTLSTFHGCPAQQIEDIAKEMIEVHGLHCVVKLNPTLLGYDAVRAILDEKGYHHITLRRKDFEGDLQWDDMMAFLPRLEESARKKGVGVGVKFSNTLVCETDTTPFAAKEMYASGPPLHVIATALADKFRRATDGRVPISFSAGVDQKNFPELAAAGLVPITTCSDILKGQGYAKLPRYLRALEGEMKAVGARTLDNFSAAKAPGEDDARGALLAAHAKSVRADARYAHVENSKPPKKVGSALHLLDCLTCDKCVSVCPNLANVSLPVRPGTYPTATVRFDGGQVTTTSGPELVVAKKAQIGNVIDLCNECGQCDPWCPEDGGPYLEKAHLFLSRRAYDDHADTPGFFVEAKDTVRWRRHDGEHRLTITDGGARLTVPTGTLELDGEFKVTRARGAGTVDLRVAQTMRLYLEAFTAPDRAHFLDVDALPEHAAS